MKCDILIKGARMLTPDMCVVENAWIAIDGVRNSAVGTGACPAYEADTVFDDPHLLWMRAVRIWRLRRKST